MAARNLIDNLHLGKVHFIKKLKKIRTTPNVSVNRICLLIEFYAWLLLSLNIAVTTEHVTNRIGYINILVPDQDKKHRFLCVLLPLTGEFLLRKYL